MPTVNIGVSRSCLLPAVNLNYYFIVIRGQQFSGLYQILSQKYEKNEEIDVI